MRTSNCSNETRALRNHQLPAAVWAAGALASALCLGAMPASAAEPPDDVEDAYEEFQEEREETVEAYEEYEEEIEEELDNDGGYFLLSPGVVMITPRLEDVGYQWGAQLGYIVRSEGLFAIGFGGNFEHGLTDLGIGREDNMLVDHQIRVEGELMPGLSLVDDRLFVHLSFGLGYAGWINRLRTPREQGIATVVAHGVAFSPGVGFNYRVGRTFTIGAAVGGDLQWLDPAGTVFEVHNVDVKVSLGWMF